MDKTSQVHNASQRGDVLEFLLFDFGGAVLKVRQILLEFVDKVDGNQNALVYQGEYDIIFVYYELPRAEIFCRIYASSDVGAGGAKHDYILQLSLIYPQQYHHMHNQNTLPASEAYVAKRLEIRVLLPTGVTVCQWMEL